MVIDTVTIRGLRNLLSFKTGFSRSSNLIYGPNGAGKTSILEAIFLLAFGRSFLHVRKADMLNPSSGEFRIIARISTAEHIETISCLFNGQSFQSFIGERSVSVSEMRRVLFPVFFSSSKYQQYIESVSLRRRMVDRFIFGVHSLYIRYILSYNSVVKQKNRLLKTSPRSAELRSWNREISELSESIVTIRRDFVERLNERLTGQFEAPLRMTYTPSFKSSPCSSHRFRRELDDVMDAEIHQRRSLKGIHLDTFDISLNQRPLKLHSSGEQKIHFLMLHMAFIRLFRDENNEFPVFLVDDYDAAMDQENIRFLLDNYPEIQMIATSVHFNAGFENAIELEKEKHWWQ